MRLLNPILVLTFIVLLSACASDQTESKIEERLEEHKEQQAELDPNDPILIAQSIADKMLTAQKEGGYYELSSEEADENMLTAMTPEVQMNAYAQIKDMFGHYESMTFEEVVKIGQGTLYNVYRFKGEFRKAVEELEVRVVLDSENKVAGFFVTPWKDEL